MDKEMSWSLTFTNLTLQIYILVSRGSSVCTATIEIRGFDFRRGLGIFPFSTASRSALGSPRLLPNAYRELFTRR